VYQWRRWRDDINKIVPTRRSSKNNVPIPIAARQRSRSPKGSYTQCRRSIRCHQSRSLSSDEFNKACSWRWVRIELPKLIRVQLRKFEYHPNATSTLWLNSSDESDPGLVATDAATTLSITSLDCENRCRAAMGWGTCFWMTFAWERVLLMSSRRAPLITLEPQSQMVIDGSNVTFSVTAIGTQPLSYQWLSMDEFGRRDKFFARSDSSDDERCGPYNVTIHDAFARRTAILRS